MPVSITPGECTYNGHGAELSVTVEHEFTPDFLPTTFHNLVINDIVDQLGPFLYETIRSGFLDSSLKPLYQARAKQLELASQSRTMIDSVLPGFVKQIAEAVAALPTLVADPVDRFALPIQKFIFDPLSHLNGDPTRDGPRLDAVASRLSVLADARLQVKSGDPMLDAALPGRIARFRRELEGFQRVRSAPWLVQSTALEFLRDIIANFTAGRRFNASLSRPFFEALYKSALPEDVTILDDVLGVQRLRERLFPVCWPGITMSCHC